MSKAYFFGFFTGLALLIVAGVTGFQLQQKDVEQANYRAELADATPMQVRKLTDKQRFHNKHFYSIYRQRTYKAISGMVTEAKGKILRIDLHVGLGEELNKPETPESYFRELSHASDAVICGKVIKKESYITEDDAFLLTDYDVVVSEVLKQNASAPFDTGTTVTVTHPGGKVLVDGVIVKAIDHTIELLPTNNDIVLFLTFIPETGAYKVTRETGSFELDGPTLRPLTRAPFPPGVLRSRDSFLKTARAVSNE